MILRRVIEHVKTQNWTAVAIDFVIVVAGVFVGLQVQEWNAARGHRVAEIGYLNSMEEDVVYSIDNLQQLLVNMERQQAAHAALYEYSVTPGAALAPDELDRLVAVGLFYLPQLDIRQVTFEALKSSGQLSAIDSPALVSRLQSLSSDVAAAGRDEVHALPQRGALSLLLHWRPHWECAPAARSAPSDRRADRRAAGRARAACGMRFRAA